MPPDVDDPVEVEGDWLVVPLRVPEEDDDGLVDVVELSVADVVSDVELPDVPVLEPDCV